MNLNTLNNLNTINSIGNNTMTTSSYNFESPSHQDRFFENLIDFGKLITELITICHEKKCDVIHPAILELGIKYVENMDRIKIIENFIEYSKDVWDKIINRDETFFSDKENGKKIFVDLPNVVDHIYVLLVTKDSDGVSIITDDDKRAIWDYADSWLKICIKYIHDKRKPKLVPTDDGKYERKYSFRYQSDIKLFKYVEYYSIELDWPSPL